MKYEKEPKNYAKISLKKSSSTGKTGYDIEVKASDDANQELLNKLAEMSIKTALKSQKIIDGGY